MSETSFALLSRTEIDNTVNSVNDLAMNLSARVHNRVPVGFYFYSIFDISFYRDGIACSRISPLSCDLRARRSSSSEIDCPTAIISERIDHYGMRSTWPRAPANNIASNWFARVRVPPRLLRVGNSTISSPFRFFASRRSPYTQHAAVETSRFPASAFVRRIRIRGTIPLPPPPSPGKTRSDRAGLIYKSSGRGPGRPSESPLRRARDYLTANGTRALRTTAEGKLTLSRTRVRNACVIIFNACARGRA